MWNMCKKLKIPLLFSVSLLSTITEFSIFLNHTLITCSFALMQDPSNPQEQVLAKEEKVRKCDHVCVYIYCMSFS